jgi:curved DNA-binding protein CbpA
LSPHDVLGVRPGATGPDVAEAFRHYALRHHPDRGGDPATFQAGVEAYRRLKGGPYRRLTARRAAPRWASPAHVVFHRRRRAGVPSLLAWLGRGRSPSRSLS